MANNKTKSYIAILIVAGFSVYLIIELVMSFFYTTSKSDAQEELIAAIAMALIALLGVILGGNSTSEANIEAFNKDKKVLTKEEIEELVKKDKEDNINN